MKVLTGVALVLSVTCFFSFSWAVRYLFRPTSRLTVQMKCLMACGIVCFIAQIRSMTHVQDSAWLIAASGISLFALSLGLFWWTVPYVRRSSLGIAFSGEHPSSLLTSGPYRYVRHPIYVSYIGYWIAGVIVSLDLWLIASVVVMTTFYWQAIREEETALRQGCLGLQYMNYMKRTGAIFPKLIGRDRL